MLLRGKKRSVCGFTSVSEAENQKDMGSSANDQSNVDKNPTRCNSMQFAASIQLLPSNVATGHVGGK